MPPVTIKHGDTFAVLDRWGGCGSSTCGEEGIYHRGTRHLSRLDLRLGGRRPVLLAPARPDRDGVVAADLTVPDIDSIPYGSVHLQRTLFLWQGSLYCHLRLTSYGMEPAALELAVTVEADFADVFEVRGVERAKRGRAWSEAGPASVVLGYEGLDGVVRRTELAFSLPPRELTADCARFRLSLEPGQPVDLYMVAAFDQDLPAATAEAFGQAQAQLRARAAARPLRLASDNPAFDRWLRQSADDLRMLETDTADGPYPYAGIPWFSTMFGRDGMITALACLWLDPAPARAVLMALAATQANSADPVRHAEPGKILHEWRAGEMAALGEVPYGRYYASADSTPLFVLLAGAYWRRTGDRATLERLWPHVERALDWIDRTGDRDGDGFVEYGHPGPQTEADRDWKQGLANQGWKDSEDAVTHADGRLAEGPIAIAEVQAYVYAARLGAAEIAQALGYAGRAGQLRRQAEDLRQRFEQAFWLEDKGTYALALDGAKQPCRVSTSNAGHVLFCGIASPERARRVAATLMGPALFTGFGIRTLAEGERRYNPIAYHNGGVWPHDTAIAAAGMARYGMTDHAARLLDGMFEAAQAVPSFRLPELFCGFPRQAAKGPVPYPVACAPQAWAAASVFLLVQAALGLEVGPDGPLRLNAPTLPECLGRLEIADIEAGGTGVDLTVHRGGSGVEVATGTGMESLVAVEA